MTTRNLINVMEKMEKIQTKTKKYDFGFDFETSGINVWRIYFVCSERKRMETEIIFRVTAHRIFDNMKPDEANEKINVFLDSLLQEVQHEQFKGKQTA